MCYERGIGRRCGSLEAPWIPYQTACDKDSGRGDRALLLRSASARSTLLFAEFMAVVLHSLWREAPAPSPVTGGTERAADLRGARGARARQPSPNWGIHAAVASSYSR